MECVLACGSVMISAHLRKNIPYISGGVLGLKELCICKDKSLARSRKEVEREELLISTW